MLNTVFFIKFIITTNTTSSKIDSPITIAIQVFAFSHPQEFVAFIINKTTAIISLHPQYITCPKEIFLQDFILY